MSVHQMYSAILPLKEMAQLSFLLTIINNYHFSLKEYIYLFVETLYFLAAFHSVNISIVSYLNLFLCVSYLSKFVN